MCIRDSLQRSRRLLEIRVRERQLALGVDAIAMQRPDRRLSGDGGPFESMLGFFTLKRERDRAHAGDEGAGHRHRRFARAFVAISRDGFPRGTLPFE